MPWEWEWWEWEPSRHTAVPQSAEPPATTPGTRPGFISFLLSSGRSLTSALSCLAHGGGESLDHIPSWCTQLACDPITHTHTPL